MVHAKLTRRRFIRGSVGVAGALAFPMVVSSRAFGANDRVQVACIGAGGKGEVDITGASAAGGTIAFLCDVDESRAAGKFKKVSSGKSYPGFPGVLEKEQKKNEAPTGFTPGHNYRTP